MNRHTAEQLEAAAGRRSRRDLWLLRMLCLDVSKLPFVWISNPKNAIFRAVQVFYLPLLKVIFKEEVNAEIKNLSSYFIFQEGLKCLELQIYAQVEKKLQTISILSTLTGWLRPITASGWIPYASEDLIAFKYPYCTPQYP